MKKSVIAGLLYNSSQYMPIKSEINYLLNRIIIPHIASIYLGKLLRETGEM